MVYNLQDMIDVLTKEGYSEANANAKVCQDIVLKALAKSPLSKHATIKGGVVMRSISGNVRRATQDMDIDFIRYSISDDAIDKFIKNLNTIENLTIKRIGKIETLKHQEYQGKRVYIEISDDTDKIIKSKIDLGVHKNLDIEQEEYCFDICMDDNGASLLINSKEQMLTEKLRSLVKFGTYSSRFKDIYDIAFLSEKISLTKLALCLQTYIYNDPTMRENNGSDIHKRLMRILTDKNYKNRLNTSEKNWLDIDTDTAIQLIIDFSKKL